uniref:Uncharacterized protein n=1 Tax=uncultured bacterium A1Q1_fos_1815 TaxID=1256553 RepID=L7VZ57_9BACT|nr:hypothetical protein [uncultured bacterium A1Q1_fos_1815]
MIDGSPCTIHPWKIPIAINQAESSEGNLASDDDVDDRRFD